MAVVLDSLAMKVGPAGSLHLQFSMICLVFLFYFLPSTVRIFAVPGAAFPFGFADLQSHALYRTTSCLPGCLPHTTTHAFVPLVVTILASLNKMLL